MQKSIHYIASLWTPDHDTHVECSVCFYWEGVPLDFGVRIVKVNCNATAFVMAVLGSTTLRC